MYKYGRIFIFDNDLLRFNIFLEDFKVIVIG